MSDYTPTTEEVRTRYAVSLFHTEHGADEHVHDSVSDGDAEFDRWLAHHDKEVAAQAIEKVASALAEPRALWWSNFYGPQVQLDEETGKKQSLDEWFADRAAEYRVADQNGDE